MKRKLENTPPSSPRTNLDDTLFIRTMQELARQPMNTYGNLSAICKLVGIDPDKQSKMELGMSLSEKIKKEDDYIRSTNGTVFVRAPVLKLMVMRVCMDGNIHASLSRKLLRYLLRLEKQYTMSSPPPSPKRQHIIASKIFFSKEELANGKGNQAVPPLPQPVETSKSNSVELLDYVERSGVLEGIMKKNKENAVFLRDENDNRILFLDGKVRIFDNRGVLMIEQPIDTKTIEAYSMKKNNMFVVQDSANETVKEFIEGKTFPIINKS